MAAKNRPAQGTPATALLSQAGVDFTVHAYGHDPAAASYGKEAADVLGVAPERVFKTLVAEVDGVLTVAVVPVAGSLDLKALAGAVGGKRAAMADPAAVTRTTGYVLGGVAPLGHPNGRLCGLTGTTPAELERQRKQRLVTVIDETANDFPTMYVSAGKRGVDVELAPADLIRLTGATLARIGRTQ
jgi:Cys-tRNA(Pro)/Cys-tRNA(Cys) deacylase